MKYLLDTHVILWIIGSSNLLSKKVKATIENSENKIYVSSVSLWEISLKFRLGKLSLSGMKPSQIPEILSKSNIETINLESADASTYGQLKVMHHRDPFDRMLIWQCILRKFTLISKDSKMKKYRSHGLKTLW
ncbi:PIN domain protein [Leptospira interrogans serovar Manilae]|uniref:PIN domain protein n=1 Tax=Leptospira interrogans serovar Manilae TaxID=214675 RepID=A0AAQ1NYC6_LEPIR|nr:type II toxin-antitoxin system VapC family toxin [Leptospira interrogans]AKP25179.1 DNA-binding protein [Leptospira interrogans serovar Manilae]AKP28962.1 DNA-binding protein [Leptospira interrogans serovar Manilae]EMJ57188.1 PIN domain protein [Leptospira interrogans serovar Valbuzzi str. Duyster]EYU63283.1 DNA-binding protein [Leptospira interrogans serovar Manilae]SOR61571.1 PIN domain protein [Leptospira interrogans serovar Manilae]